MSKTSKAVLASAFIFPGVGHIILKRYRSSIALMAVTLSAVVVLLTHVIKITTKISTQILNGEVAPDLLFITKLVNDQLANSQTHWITISTWGIVTMWIMGMLDAYRVGRAQEK